MTPCVLFILDMPTNLPEPTSEELDRILSQHVVAAMGVSLMPIPVVDIVGLTGVQFNLLRQLAGAYQVPFLDDAVKHMILSLLGKTMLVKLGPQVLASLVKFIPGAGQTAGALALPVLAGASTYATGKVFIRHFASGGTFLSFDPEKMKSYYEDMFKKGRQIATNMK